MGHVHKYSVTSKLSPIPPSTPRGKQYSEILYGVEKAVGRGIYFMANVKEKMDICFDNKGPSIVIEIKEYSNGYGDIRTRGGKIRAFTEITKENIHYCKELINIVDELRHLDGVKGGIAVSESEYMATTVLDEAKPLTQVIYSSNKEVVDQGQYIFDTLWNAAIPAEQKIRELEGGIQTYRTKILEDPEEIIKEIGHLTSESNELSTCITSGGLQFSYSYFFDIKKELLAKEAKGEHLGIRYVTNIDRYNSKLAEIFLETGIQIRHIKNSPPMSFGVSDKEIAATIEKMEDGKRVQSLLISNEPLYVKHFKSLFEELWNNGIDASDRIKDIEQGVQADVEVIQNSTKAKETYLNIVKSAEKEVMILFPTTNAFIRQEKIGVLRSLTEVLRDRTSLKIRILMPGHALTERAVQELIQNGVNSNVKIDIRYLDQISDTKATILIVDRNVSLVMELKDDLKESFEEAIGLSTYSNSRAGVLSYVSIFENLWKQTDLYQQVKHALTLLADTNKQLESANQKLEVQGKMQSEFINVAAHELRTPIQPILGLTEILRSSKKRCIEEQDELLDIIIRNAKKLKRLTEDILDVTKIEGKLLRLTLQDVNLNELISNVLSDYGDQIKKLSDKDVKITFETKENQVIVVRADKIRLSQVVSNLLDNAIKFTKGGTITLSLAVERKDKHESSNTWIAQNENSDNKGDNSNKGVAIVKIKDTGSGISPDIQSRLFSKFASKSFEGTGLGLFICKSIIEAHGGKVWAENNADRKGATFSFSLKL
jgi:two-component system, OmpR family, sensor histidine kinase VicK